MFFALFAEFNLSSSGPGGGFPYSGESEMNRNPIFFQLIYVLSDIFVGTCLQLRAFVTFLLPRNLNLLSPP